VIAHVHVQAHGSIMPLARLKRRIQFGRPIIVVSGLPRSGTSMMMKMLAAGGLPLMTDGVRTPDDSNPEGYFELEAVKDLDKGVDLSWLQVTRGKGVKILSPLLTHLPEHYNYRVILMLRPLAEVIESQNKMLARAGEPTDVTSIATLTAQYESHLAKVRALLASRPCFESISVQYGDVVANPEAEARRVARFIRRRLAIDAMAAAVNERLYRNRSDRLTR
jgi:hypothetical protein